MCRDSTPEEVLAVLSLVHGEAWQVFGGRWSPLGTPILMSHSLNINGRAATPKQK